jgi:hypothetical protein
MCTECCSTCTHKECETDTYDKSSLVMDMIRTKMVERGSIP